MKYVFCEFEPSLYSCNFTSTEQPIVHPGDINASLLAIKCTSDVFPTPKIGKNVKHKLSKQFLFICHLCFVPESPTTMIRTLSIAAIH